MFVAQKKKNARKFREVCEKNWRDGHWETEIVCGVHTPFGAPEEERPVEAGALSDAAMQTRSCGVTLSDRQGLHPPWSPFSRASRAPRPRRTPCTFDRRSVSPTMASRASLRLGCRSVLRAPSGRVAVRRLQFVVGGFLRTNAAVTRSSSTCTGSCSKRIVSSAPLPSVLLPVPPLGAPLSGVLACRWLSRLPLHMRTRSKCPASRDATQQRRRWSKQEHCVCLPSSWFGAHHTGPTPEPRRFGRRFSDTLVPPYLVRSFVTQHVEHGPVEALGHGYVRNGIHLCRPFCRSVVLFAVFYASAFHTFLVKSARPCPLGRHGGPTSTPLNIQYSSVHNLHTYSHCPKVSEKEIRLRIAQTGSFTVTDVDITKSRVWIFIRTRRVHHWIVNVWIVCGGGST